MTITRGSEAASDRPARVVQLPAPSVGADLLRIRPWVDPLVEALGYDPRSDYVEQFWLAALGPSTIFLLRFIARALEDQPEGFDCTGRDLGWALGLGRSGRSKTLVRSLRRAVDFGMIRLDASGAILVRRRLPPLSQRQISQLPARLQAAHRAWTERQSRPPMPPTRPPGSIERTGPLS
ncbi:MAG TPA: hypothetical protein VNF50_01500 [Acidimicrobiales bacterium]|nr:hypothetical protein [Acidimicrobiales bacterium]